MNTVGIVPRCKLCRKYYTVFSVSVSHEKTHCNLYMECLCVVCGVEKTIVWSFEQLSYYAMKLLDETGEDREPDEGDVLFKLPKTEEIN